MVSPILYFSVSSTATLWLNIVSHRVIVKPSAIHRVHVQQREFKLFCCLTVSLPHRALEDNHQKQNSEIWEQPSTKNHWSWFNLHLLCFSDKTGMIKYNDSATERTQLSETAIHEMNSNLQTAKHSKCRSVHSSLHSLYSSLMRCTKQPSKTKI